MTAVTTLATVTDSQAVTVLATDASGAIVTAPDTSWKDAIDKYDSDVKSGRITFNAAGFANSYAGQAETDASLARFVDAHVDGEPFSYAR
jgi:hypothetical protein